MEDTVEIEASVEEVATISRSEQEELAASLGLEFVPVLGEINPPRELEHGEFSRIIGAWAKQFKIIPLKEENGVIVAAVSDPLDTDAIDSLKIAYGMPVRVVVAPESEIIRGINSIRTSLMTDRSSGLETTDNLRSAEIETSLKIDVTDAEDEDAPIMRYVNTLLFRAANERASDIHIEPFEDLLKVRFRIDGVLHDVDVEDKVFQAAIISRIKVMANLDIAEKRLPQDGRIGIRIAGRDVDIRVSTIPTRFGERIVLRLLDKSQVVLDLELLGLSIRNRQVVEKLIKKSHGIILVTGPTGSGKTTTLYACLSRINSPNLNILTVEDPVEYELKGIGQMQVNTKTNFTFANGLRSILRQDPDVIMVGEIRDLETAEIAIQASLTGHLVLSTLHTNDAPGAVTRLLDMGVEPFLISSSVLALLAQRLVRTLCPSCRKRRALLPEEARVLGVDPRKAGEIVIFGPSEEGCPHCQGSGYYGRTGIHELLLVDEKVRSKIMSRADSSSIRQAASSFMGLRADGAEKVLAGVTSFEEVIRVTQEEFLD